MLQWSVRKCGMLPSLTTAYLDCADDSLLLCLPVLLLNVAAPLRDPKGKITQICRCKAGHGSTSGSTCRLCPIGSFAEGGTMDDCQPCSFGYTSRAGADSQRECVPEAQACPVGQIAPPDAVSEELCGCLPGYGGERLSVEMGGYLLGRSGQLFMRAVSDGSAGCCCCC